MEISVKSLFIYPLKSAQGIALNEMPIVSSGPKHDREWMLINRKTKKFISQRTHPMLSQVTTKFCREGLVINFPEKNEQLIPFERTNGKTIEVTLFEKSTTGEKVDSSLDTWFSEVLDSEVELVRSPSSVSRKTSGNHGPVTEILFPDGYPFLLTNQSTLDELNEKLPVAVEMNRFRPNIVIQGADRNIEDQWRSLTIGGLSFLSVKACSRCAIIDVDPHTGRKAKDVSPTLKSYRSKGGSTLFGVNLTHQNQGTIKVGDKITNVSYQ